VSASIEGGAIPVQGPTYVNHRALLTTDFGAHSGEQIAIELQVPSKAILTMPSPQPSPDPPAANDSSSALSALL
jgi:hypothetical protein